MKHLIDEELQDYLDGNLSGEQRTTAVRHLESCTFCQNEMRLYQSLRTQLRADPGFQLSHKLGRSVLSKIQKESLGTVHGQLWQVFLALLGLVVCLNITFYFFDFRPMVKEVQAIPAPKLDPFFEILPQIKTFFSGLNMNLTLLVFAGLALLVISGIDHLIQSKRKPLSLTIW